MYRGLTATWERRVESRLRHALSHCKKNSVRKYGRPTSNAGRQQTADNRQQTADSRQRTADSREQTAGSRQCYPIFTQIFWTSQRVPSIEAASACVVTVVLQGLWWACACVMLVLACVAHTSRMTACLWCACEHM
jgi:hypothetical protein